MKHLLPLLSLCLAIGCATTDSPRTLLKQADYRRLILENPGSAEPLYRELLQSPRVDAATRARVAHDIDGVEVRRPVILGVFLEAPNHLTGHRHTGVGPGINDLVVSFALREDTVLEIAVDRADLGFGVRDYLCLPPRNLEIGQAEA